MEAFIKTLKSCGYKVIQAEDKNEALDISKSLIKSGMSVGLGGSTTVKDIGLLDELVSRDDIILHNQYELGITMQENTKRRRDGILTDIYVCSTNAITKDGKLINADGSGNRTAAMIFGPKEVLLIVGKNKIVEDTQEGLHRLMNIAAIKNINRMNTIAINANKEPIHNLDNIANKFTQIKADEQDRITIILVNEELGY